MPDMRDGLCRRRLLTAVGVGVATSLPGCAALRGETPSETTTTTPRSVFVDRTFTVKARFRATITLQERSTVAVAFDTQTDFAVDVYTVRASQIGSFVDPGELSPHVEALTFLDTQTGSGRTQLDATEWAIVVDNTARTGAATPPADGPAAAVHLMVSED